MDPIDLNAMDLSGSGAAQNAGSNAGSNTAPSLTPELAQALFATIRSQQELEATRAEAARGAARPRLKWPEWSGDLETLPT